MKPRSILTGSRAAAEAERPPFATTTASYLGLTLAELQDELEAAILIEAGSHLRDAGALVAGPTAHVGAFVERPPPPPDRSRVQYKAVASCRLNRELSGCSWPSSAKRATM